MEDNVDEVEKINYANDLRDFVDTCQLKSIVEDDSNLLSFSTMSLPVCYRTSLFDCLKTNMKSIYQSTEWGWNDKEKNNELFHPTSRFLILTDPSNPEAVRAFTMFRFEWDDEDEPVHPVLYCYEVQVVPGHLRKGYGRVLMSMLQRIATHCRMWKTMLTCFKINSAAINFYKQIGFGIDVNSPSSYGHCDEPHEILSDKPKLR